VDNLSEEIDGMIESSAHFLENMMEDSGKFNYGYFPHFDKEIGFYNILRHSSSTYALIEGLNYLGEPLNSTEKAINYVIENHIYESNGNAYV
ncbi:poly(glycerol-phosphate) alpha-glucosyltransferase, partial [Staphylococcus lugdunensis]